MQMNLVITLNAQKKSLSHGFYLKCLSILNYAGIIQVI